MSVENKDEVETPIFQFPNLQLEKIENDVKEWKNELKEMFIKKGTTENLITELYQVLERSNCWNVKPEENPEQDLSMLIYNKLKDDIKPVKDLIKEQIQSIMENNQDLKYKMKKKVKKHIESIKDHIELESNQDVIKEQMNKLELLLVQNKKEKKTKPKKKPPPPQNEIDLSDDFESCGQVNSRGKPCLRRKVTCPYHNK